jgi:hypothetical protein
MSLTNSGFASGQLSRTSVANFSPENGMLFDCVLARFSSFSAIDSRSGAYQRSDIGGISTDWPTGGGVKGS